MAVARLDDLIRLAQASFDLAKDAAESINLSTVARFEESVKYARAKSLSVNARLLSDEPGYDDLPTYRGIKAWGALLSFDMRRSSELAKKVSPRNMYIIMHTYLPTTLAVIQEGGGIVVGLRGDGAIACFGLVEVGEDRPRVTTKQAEEAVTAACDCGDAIVKAVQKAVNPVIEAGGIKVGKLQVGVGIDVGEIVGTKIGLGEAHELTAYGNAVNQCCKRSFGNDAVILTKLAKDMFPKGDNGKTKFRAYPEREDAYVLHYPTSYNTLS